MFKKKKYFSLRNTFPCTVITIYSCYKRSLFNYGVSSDHRRENVKSCTSEVNFSVQSACYGTICSRQNRSAAIGTRNNMPYWRHLLMLQRANLLSYKCITTLWIETRRDREGGKRVAHWELKARCHIIIVLWRAQASRLGDDKNECRHAELSFTLH